MILNKPKVLNEFKAAFTIFLLQYIPKKKHKIWTVILAYANDIWVKNEEFSKSSYSSQY
jgi:hypothetical protein